MNDKELKKRAKAFAESDCVAELLTINNEQ